MTMTGTAARMAARLAATPPAQQGRACRACATTALACQLQFVTTDTWCCPTCRNDGGGSAHGARRTADG